DLQYPSGEPGRGRMQTKKNRYRWTTLTLLIVLMTAAAVWLGSDRADWQGATSATGDYVIEFPGQPSTETMQIPDSDLSMQLTALEADSGYYALFETALNGITPNPLDVAVDSSIENARAKMESRRNSPVAVREISRTTGDFEGVETRKFRVKLVGRGGADWAAITGLLFYRDDVIVSAIVVTDPNLEPSLAERFLSSLKSKPEPNLRALPQRLFEIGD
ncbi:MAG TPA: hypothetical protein VMS92_25235, partial [Mycobacterium sp.]|nr:hypothetical protein [Mycobacterium sp.]